MSDLISFLFKTNAISVCPENKPFWLTSGKIGPYYINSEYLYGSKQDSIELLEFINTEKKNKIELPQKVFETVHKQYEKNNIFHHVIEEMKEQIETKVNVAKIDYVSGGERRDWFFSYMIAKLLKKPHITIFKDLTTVVSDSNFEHTQSIADINGANVLHVADLITEASSYLRAWIPAIDKLGGKICSSICVIDRMQGGTKKLESLGINCMSLVKVQKDLFDVALGLKIINVEQYKMICEYINNPDGTMKTFVEEHPEFIKNALQSDEKTAERARLCLEKKWYL